MENSNITPEDIKTKVKDIVYTQGRILAELLQAVHASSQLFARLNEGIFEPLNGTIEFIYNPLVNEDGSRKITRTSTKNLHQGQ